MDILHVNHGQPVDTLAYIKVKVVPYTKRVSKVLELITVLISQPAGDQSHKPGGRLPLLSTRPTVTSSAAKYQRPLADNKLYCLVTEAHMCKH